MSNRIKFYILGAICLGLLGGIATLIWMVNSAAYEAAKQFIYASPQVGERIGAVKSTRLSWYGGAITHRGGVATAHFHMVANGENSVGNVYVELEKIDDVWKIQGGKLSTNDGAEISLTP